jgi:hypothetical protein
MFSSPLDSALRPNWRFARRTVVRFLLVDRLQCQV